MVVGYLFFQTGELKGSGGLASFIIIFALLLVVWLFWEDLWEKDLPSIFITETALFLAYKEKEQQSGDQYILFEEVAIIHLSFDIWGGTSLYIIAYCQRDRHKVQCTEVVVGEGDLASEEAFLAFKDHIIEKLRESNSSSSVADRTVISL